MHWVRYCALVVLVFMHVPAIAGEIPGLPPQIPPFIERDLEVVFSNDFLGRGGSIDDFRTQQIVIAAKLSDNWIAILDHSILTLGSSLTPGRVDQMSASLGYQIVNKVNDHSASKINAGIGVRSAGDFAGERMQNGFHRLIGSDIEVLPYTDTDSTDVTAWFDVDHYRDFHYSGSWRTGYWVRASSLLTSGGQWDGSAGLFGVASRPSLDIWLGLRRDWRSGYNRAIFRETAKAEDDTAIVLGVRFGALVLETVQQLNNDASYGQLRLVSSGARAATPQSGISRWGLEAGFLMPDIQLRFAARYRSRLFTDAGSRWREAIVVAASYGEPQYEDNPDIFVHSRQFDVGLDLERSLSDRSDWLSMYGMAGAGWRNERLIGVNTLQSEASGSASRAVLSFGAGLRINAAALGENWNYRIQLGFIGRLPIQDADLQLGATTLAVQQPALDFLLGMTFDFE